MQEVKTATWYRELGQRMEVTKGCESADRAIKRLCEVPGIGLAGAPELLLAIAQHPEVKEYLDKLQRAREKQKRERAQVS